MKVSKISVYPNNRYLTTIDNKKKINVETSYKKIVHPYFYKENIQPIKLYKTIQFKGSTVHIVDGGIHATNMKYFAKYLKNDLNTIIHPVEINPKDRYTKQLKSLEQQLVLLNKNSLNSCEYVAIPALASVSLLNIQDQYNRITGSNEIFTPENVKEKKEKLLNFLQQIYNTPQKYRQYIDYMDPIHQGLEYVYGVIQEINKLIEKDLKVYIPSGHPDDATLKWMAEERGLKPELYHYIATGEDINNSIKSMKEDIRNKNWYNFNLLALSNANIIGIKDRSGEKDYIFAAYDSCVTDSARGTYNLSPVRDGNKVVGYSFSDESTNNYPYEEFPYNEEVSNLLKFVGKNKQDVLANDQQVEHFLSNYSMQQKSDLLYPVEKIFSMEKIQRDKINLQGKYVDSSLKLFFDENNDGKIIFKKCDCEGSGRPSILSVWGSCYAVFNAIARNINLLKGFAYISLSTTLALAKRVKNENASNYEQLLNEAVRKEKKAELFDSNSRDRIEPYLMLAEIYQERKDFDRALSYLNHAMDIISSQFLKERFEDLQDLKLQYASYITSQKNSEQYDKEIHIYNHLSFIEKLFTNKPSKPYDYNKFKDERSLQQDYQFYMINFIKIYKQIADICELKGEEYPARVCKAAITDIQAGTNRGYEILKKRANKIQYIGDLYNEIEPNK